jgi:hypothetical protein
VTDNNKQAKNKLTKSAAAQSLKQETQDAAGIFGDSAALDEWAKSELERRKQRKEQP